MRTLLPLSVVVATLALAACDSADKGPKTLDQAKAEAKQLERPEPGQYEQTMKFTKFDVPGAPKEMVEQIKTMMQGAGQSVKYCLTKAQSDKGFEDMFKKIGEGECKYERFDASSSRIDAIMVCTNPNGGTARLAMNGSVSKTGSAVKVDVQQKDDKTPMGNANIAMEVSTKRVGD
ncbi:MAG: DUF3617 domain-containing protein, partial [Novosphingobium sp.]